MASIPLYSLCFRVWMSVESKVNAYAFGIPAYIVSFYRFLCNSMTVLFTPVEYFPKYWRHMISRNFTLKFKPQQSTHPQILVKMNNICRWCITATAGTSFCSRLSIITIKYHITYWSLRHTCLLSFTKYYWIKVSFIVQNSSLLPL